MATNTVRWVGNLDGASGPLITLGSFQAGATQAIKKGELLEFTGDSNTDWVPLDSDFAMNGNVAIANEEIKDGDRAGYYEIIVPRPGDIFEYELATADATAVGTALYYSSSEKVTVTAGTNALGYAVGQEHYPGKQGHLTDDAKGDAGTTVRSTTHVRMTIATSASLYCLLVRSDRTPTIGDAGGYAGWVWRAAQTDMGGYGDATLWASLENDGTWTDEVS